jgi:4-amino-4-deoxy-L-arabinose transferase-like glycosyltransferase
MGPVMKEKIKSRGLFETTSDLGLIIGLVALALSTRLIKISQPYVDEWSFKQGTIAMIAENFYRNGFNFLYPQINWAGSSAGYIGTEFPLVPFLASLLYVPFGVHEWIGRSISVAFFTLSLPFFYFLVKQTSNQQSAAFAGAIYALAPLSVFASRSFMSDMTSLSFSVIALYAFMRWLERSDSFALLSAASLATALAILTKAPAAIIGLPLLYMAWEQYGARLVLRPRLWFFAAIALCLPLAWYLHAYFITVHYPPHQFAGSDGLALADLPLYVLIVRRLVGSSLTPLVAATMLAGIFIPCRAKYGRVFHWWLFVTCIFVLIAGHGNRHPWYQLPMVPIAAALGGRAFDFGLKRLAALTDSRVIEASVAAIVLCALAFGSYLYVKPLYDPWAIPLREAGENIDRIAPPEALTIFVADGDSSEIYYSRRKGWHAFDDNYWGEPLDSEQAIMDLEKLRERGAVYLVFTRYTAWWLDYYRDFQKYLDSRYRRVLQTENYVIFDLTEARN